MKDDGKPGPGDIARALSQSIEKRAMREGLSTWLEQIAHDRSSVHVETRTGLLAFLAAESASRVRVVLKDSLRSESGFVLEARVTDEGFVLSDAATEESNPRFIRFSQVALYQLVDSGRIASGGLADS